jgi:hypothetical protein
LKLLKQYLRYISLLLLLSLILLLLANTPIVIYLHLLEASLPLSAKILFAPLRLLKYRIWIEWVEELLSMTCSITCYFVRWLCFQDVKDWFVDILIYAFLNFTQVVFVGAESFRKEWRWRLFPIIWCLLRLRTYNNGC